MKQNQVPRDPARRRCYKLVFIIPMMTVILSFLAAQTVQAQDFTNTGQLHVNETTTVHLSNFINNTSASVTNDGNVEVAGDLDFQNGEIDEPNSGIVIFFDNATASNASDTSHVDGLVRKIGDDAFIFPIGDGGQLGPLGISAPSVVTDQVDARYWLSDPQNDAGSTLDTGLTDVSSVEYWNLSGTPSVNLTLHWDVGSNVGSLASNLADLRIVGWDNAKWVDLGNDGTAGDASSGTITANGVTPDTYAAYTFGTVSSTNDTSLTKAFSPADIIEGAISTLTFTITENTSDDSQDNIVSFLDTLPAGVEIAANPNLQQSCSGGTITAIAGGSTIDVAGTTLTNGMGSCTISVDVTAPAAGSYVSGSANISGLAGAVLDDMTDQTLTVTVAPLANIAIDVTLNTISPARQTEAISFTVTITNLDAAPLTSLPLINAFPGVYMPCTSATQTPDSTTLNQLKWTDLLATAGITLNQNQSISYDVTCTADLDTTLLPNQAAFFRAEAVDKSDSAEIGIFAPTSVTVAQRRVQFDADSGRVILTWSTADESQIAGFHIYRLEQQVDEDGGSEWIRLTEEPLSSQQTGRTSGATYTYEDWVDITVIHAQLVINEATIAELAGRPQYKLGVITIDGREYFLDMREENATNGIYFPFISR
ncbi:MAG: hypothetical protein AAF702_16320 [Chloroflexota bacterium]